jgi:phosphoribosylglycinamide formyltransferase 1
MSIAPHGLVVLISGRGSNLGAILDAIRRGEVKAGIRAVVCNRPDAPGLALARATGVPTQVIDHRQFSDRAAYDRALMAAIDAYAPQLVVLAGFMRILGAEFIDHYAGRLINIHPSLLPRFPGLRTHARAIETGARVHGASVHFVAHDVDAGPIIVQAAVPVLPGDTPATLAERVLEQEHRIYPLAIAWFLAGRLTVRGGRVLLDGAVRPEQGLREETGGG